MVDLVTCPECGQMVRKGSTHCMNCGNRLPDGLPVVEPESSKVLKTDHEDKTDDEIEIDDDIPEDSPISDDVDEDLTLPPIDDSLLEDIPEDTSPPTTDSELSWDEDDLTEETKPVEDSGLVEIEPPKVSSEPPDIVIRDYEDKELSWDESVVEEVMKEDTSIREVETPVVHDTPAKTPEVIHSHPATEDTSDRGEHDFVSHLFPEGRESRSKDFIDVVVGKPDKVAVEDPMRELETPSCPNCGFALSGDEFEYPDYVFEAMGKARIEYGELKLEAGEHEAAIEAFEKAKILYERAKNEKMIAECVKLIDEGYGEMASEHFEQAEHHQKSHEYEWAIVQYKKAREIYMFTTDRKKRAKCAQKARECFVDWGKDLESEGDHLAKEGNSRAALEKYRIAAEKYKEGDDSKKLRGLEKKIRRA